MKPKTRIQSFFSSLVAFYTRKKIYVVLYNSFNRQNKSFVILTVLRPKRVCGAHLQATHPFKYICWSGGRYSKCDVQRHSTQFFHNLLRFQPCCPWNFVTISKSVTKHTKVSFSFYLDETFCKKELATSYIFISNKLLYWSRPHQGLNKTERTNFEICFASLNKEANKAIN